MKGLVLREASDEVLDGFAGLTPVDIVSVALLVERLQVLDVLEHGQVRTWEDGAPGRHSFEVDGFVVAAHGVRQIHVICIYANFVFIICIRIYWEWTDLWRG